MKSLKLVIFSLLTYPAFAQTAFRFEAETGISSLRLPQPYRTGWHVRQQLTAYVRPRFGIALGMGWGGSANNDPLQPSLQTGRPNLRALLDYYTRQERMTDLSAVWLPVLSRRHQLKMQVGLSFKGRREVNVDSIFLLPAPENFNVALPTYTDQSRVMPMVALGYDYRLSPRWAVGVNAVAYFPGNEKAIGTVGFRTSYRFNISRDSLGISNPASAGQAPSGELLSWGLRVAGSLVGANGSGTNGRDVTKLVAGLWADYPLSLTWSMRGEVNYAQRGYRSEGYSTGSRSATGFRANATYLELPLLFRHEAAERWHLYAGPYLAFMLNGTSQQEGFPAVEVGSHTNSGFMLGADYQLTKKLSVDLRYQRDLIQLSTSPYSNAFHSYQLGVNWTIR